MKFIHYISLFKALYCICETNKIQVISIPLMFVSANESSVSGGCLVPGISSQIFSSVLHTSFKPTGNN